MFILKSTHYAEISALRAQLAEREARIVELNGQVESAKETTHDFVENFRYAVEAASYAMEFSMPVDTDELKKIGHCLPYLLSGRRHWRDLFDTPPGEGALSAAAEIAEKHGFDLPQEPVPRTMAMIKLIRILCDGTHDSFIQELRSCRRLVPQA